MNGGGGVQQRGKCYIMYWDGRLLCTNYNKCNKFTHMDKSNFICNLFLNLSCTENANNGKFVFTENSNGYAYLQTVKGTREQRGCRVALAFVIFTNTHKRQ